jgi:hypothetical protein
MKPSDFHIVLLDDSHGVEAHSLKCLHCGQIHKLTMPIAITKFAKAVKAFEALHKDCKEQDNMRKDGEG